MIQVSSWTITFSVKVVEPEEQSFLNDREINRGCKIRSTDKATDSTEYIKGERFARTDVLWKSERTIWYDAALGIGPGLIRERGATYALF